MHKLEMSLHLFYLFLIFFKFKYIHTYIYIYIYTHIYKLNQRKVEPAKKAGSTLKFNNKYFE